MAVVDELSAAAELVKGKYDQVPVGSGPGLGATGGPDGDGAGVLVRLAENDCSRWVREAVAAAGWDACDCPMWTVSARYRRSGPADRGLETVGWPVPAGGGGAADNTVADRPGYGRPPGLLTARRTGGRRPGGGGPTPVARRTAGRRGWSAPGCPRSRSTAGHPARRGRTSPTRIGHPTDPLGGAMTRESSSIW